MLCFWVLMWTEMLLSTIGWLCMANNTFFSPPWDILLNSCSAFLAVWRLGVYLSVGTGAVRGVADSSLGIPSPLGQDLSTSFRSAAHIGVVGHPSCLCFCAFPGIIFLWTGHLCLEFEQSLHVCLTCVMPWLFHPPSVALGKWFDGSDQSFSPFFSARPAFCSPAKLRAQPALPNCWNFGS